MATEIEDAIFLGAGASRSEGAPVQADLFKKYFQICKPIESGANNRQKTLYERMGKFFKEFFGINVESDDLDETSFPTFEEALGILELAEKREECFKGWGSKSPNSDIKIQRYRQSLIFLIATVLERSLQGRAAYHEKLVQRLEREQNLPKTALISVNYEILIDNALERHYGGLIDYGVPIPRYDAARDFHLDSLRGRNIMAETICLLKLHGSLNWLYCPTCISLEITPLEKSASRLVHESKRCERCNSNIAPIIVPPTFFKVMSNHFLEQIWHKTDLILRTIKRIFFCGYSFPDADIHIKYLLKRAELYSSRGLEVYVINRPDPMSLASKNEAERYKRFFKNKSGVHYLNGSFEQFCESGEAGMSECEFLNAGRFVR